MNNKPLLIIGSSGRMAKEVREECERQNRPFVIWSENCASAKRCEDWSMTSGIVDFSTVEAFPLIAQRAVQFHIPWVCGTTGFKDLLSRDQILAETSKSIPVVFDSNFSLGVELLCQASELVAKKIVATFHLLDIHHQHKKDAPSGTALKIKERIRHTRDLPVTIESVREGEVPGEHRVQISFGSETLEWIHRAHSREPFARGAIAALDWLKERSAGLYSMKDVL